MVVLIPKGSCFSDVFSWISVSCYAGGPNPVLSTTKLHVCKKWRVMYGQAEEWFYLWISSSYWLCLQEMQCSPCTLLAANASVNIGSSAYFAAHALKAPKKPTRAMLVFSSPQKPRAHLQRALQTCCADGHLHVLCSREPLSGHLTAIRGHQNVSVIFWLSLWLQSIEVFLAIAWMHLELKKAPCLLLAGDYWAYGVNVKNMSSRGTDLNQSWS